MRKSLFIGLLCSVAFMGNAMAKDTSLFECKFEQGGSVKATRDSRQVKIVFTDANGKQEKVASSLMETGVSNVQAVDGTVVDGLDILEGDTQYSISYMHGKLMDRAQFLIMTDNEQGDTYDCDLTKTVNKLDNAKATSGIFRP